MKYQPTVLSQLLQLISRDTFQKIVDKHKGDYKVHKLSCWTQFVSLFYAQLRQRDSLRDIETGLDVHLNKLYHLGIQSVKRSTLSDANNNRDSVIYEDVFHYLLGKCQMFSRKNLGFYNPISSFDATTINLCHSLFPWATYRQTKGAIKLHLQLNHNDDLPEFVRITDGNVHEITIARELDRSKPDSIWVFDRGMYDFTWFKQLDEARITFVCRAKKDISYTVIGQHAVNPDSNVISDEDIRVPWRHKPQPSLRPKYDKPLRLVTVLDPETGKIVRFLTNNETFKAETIALIYRQRWKIELFFKWIKQNLKIKTFLGTSRNAVMTQIWIALILYLILWFMKKQTRYRFSLLKLTRILNETAFERVHLLDILGLSGKLPKTIPEPQLSFAFF